MNWLKQWWVDRNPSAYHPDGTKHEFYQDGYYEDKYCIHCPETRPGDILPRID